MKINPVREPRVPGLLFVFIALSILVHSTMLLLSNKTAIAVSEPNFGNPIISTVLVTANTQPSDNVPQHKAATVTKPRNNTDQAAREQANTTSATSPLVLSKTPVESTAKENATNKQNEPQQTDVIETQQSTTLSSETPISSDSTFAAQQRDKQRNYLLGKLHSRLSQYLTYPLRARKRGWQGKVMVALHINEHGQLNKPQLARSSGYTLLDHSAIDAVGKLQHISMPQHLGPPQAMDLLLPINYQLQEG